MKNFNSITVKFSLFIISFVVFLFPLVSEIDKYEKKYMKRSSIIHRDDMKNYNYILLGDSGFCSFYVNDDNDSIWEKFKIITGYEMFPGALNGAKIGDYVSASNYISKELKDNSTVFINIIPTRFIFRDENERNNYDQQFYNLEKYRNINIICKFINYFDKNYLEFIFKYLNGKKTDRNLGENHNRVWNIDGDFAKKRYIHLIKIKKNKFKNEELSILEEINKIFTKKNINTVFVISPLNKNLIYSYSDISDADNIYSYINETHDKTIKYLIKINASTIDLFDKVPDSCFSDLVHTNSCGDEIIARSLADYALKNRK